MHCVSAAAFFFLAMGMTCNAAQAAGTSLMPDAAFVQAGSAEDTNAITAGLIWGWKRSWRLGSGDVTGYWDMSMSRWSYRAGERRSAWLAQVGIKPVVRWRPGSGWRWFLEGGIGASFTTNVYETDRKRFSTTFNFGDHIAVGMMLDPASRHELSLRFEHFSNAGIKHPNPGENFVQLRYTGRF